MDEECLARYEVGGMEFKDLSAFDEWLVRPENMERLLPFPRCVVSFRVRRERKHREIHRLIDIFDAIEKESADKLTFLYIRNGEQVFRLNTAQEFGEKLFPDMERRLLEGRIWGKEFAGRFDEDSLISDDDYQVRRKEYAKKLCEWRKLRKKDSESWRPRPHSELGRYVPFDPSSVYYDDIAAVVQKMIQDHNRVALILQGLLDRSLVLHPHPPWQIWTSEGFTSALELVYDDSRALVAGDLPDFKAYRAECNASLKVGSVTIGQEEVWLRLEAEKENRRRDRDYRDRGDYRPEHYRPYGNPGPGYLARVTQLRGGKATFEWVRRRQTTTWKAAYGDPIPVKLSCPTHLLFNVDAYKPGDYRRFFDDPRTRKEYLRWAPILIEAEEYHAGNRKVGPEDDS